MPLPLAFIAPAIWSAISANIGRLIAVKLFYDVTQERKEQIRAGIVSFLESESVKAFIIQQLAPIVCDYIHQRTGITLDPQDPFSKQSLTDGISARIGVALYDISDPDQIALDMGLMVSTKLNSALGSSLPQLNLNDPAQMKAALRAELTDQLARELADLPSVLDPASMDQLRALVLASVDPVTGEQVTVPYTSKRKLQNRIHSRRHYAKQRAAGLKRAWKPV